MLREKEKESSHTTKRHSRLMSREKCRNDPPGSSSRLSFLWSKLASHYCMCSFDFPQDIVLHKVITFSSKPVWMIVWFPIFYLWKRELNSYLDAALCFGEKGFTAFFFISWFCILFMSFSFLSLVLGRNCKPLSNLLSTGSGRFRFLESLLTQSSKVCSFLVVHRLSSTLVSLCEQIVLWYDLVKMFSCQCNSWYLNSLILISCRMYISLAFTQAA